MFGVLSRVGGTWGAWSTRRKAGGFEGGRLRRRSGFAWEGKKIEWRFGRFGEEYVCMLSIRI
jgi:hypothetical protein